MTPAPVSRVAGVVGLGVVGCSVCLALHRAGYSVVGHDTYPERGEFVLSRGAIDEVVSSPVMLAAHSPDIVIVAVPPLSVVPICAQLLAQGLVVTDVCSVKTEIVAAFGGYPSFLGSHPMAGSERSGPAAAREDLFVGANWVLTPGHATDVRTVAVVSRTVEAMGATPVVLDPRTHDEGVAFTSHLPHVVAAALSTAVSQAEPDVGRLAGPGFRDTTRVANGPVPLWTEILEANRDNVASAILTVRTELGHIEQALRCGDTDALAAHLGRGVSARERILLKSAVGIARERATTAHQ